MRKSSPIILLTLAVGLTLAVLFAAVGCDYGTSPSEGATTSSSQTVQTQPPQLAGSADPTAILEAMMGASGDMTRFACTFDADVQLTLDSEGMMQEDAMFLNMFQGPLTLSGDMSFDQEARATEMDLTFAVAGITYNMGIRSLDDMIWLSMLGQWYDLSPALAELGESDLYDQSLDVEAIEARMSALEIDPLEWLGDVTLQGEETLDGSAAYHLTCTPDVSLIMEDVFTLIEDEEFMDLLDPTGELSASMTEDLPTQADMDEISDMLPAMLSDFTIDLWAGKDDSLLRQVEISMHLAPPPGEPTDGVESIDLDIKLAFEDLDEPLQVEAPENALPYTDLPDLFGSDLPLDMEGLLDGAADL